MQNFSCVLLVEKAEFNFSAGPDL